MSSPCGSLLIGIMSGTSLDGVDVALVRIQARELTTLHTQFTDFEPDLKAALAELAGATHWEPDNYYQTEYRLTEFYSRAVNQLLTNTRNSATDITAIACHGQTVRHRPDLYTPYTVQLVNAALLTEKTGITVITDFRARDMAAGGEGAPLAPGFHYHFFSARYKRACVVNIGGFANLTYWDESAKVIGYDTGPGNVLLDAWMQCEFNQDFDKDGQLCQRGSIDQNLLATLSRDPYFNKSSPKSTGREYFNMAWLRHQLLAHPDIPAVSVLTTLAELTATTIAAEIEKYQADNILVCGGGVKNVFVMERLQYLLPTRQVATTMAAGIDPHFVEAIAFAWFGYQTLNKKASNCPTVTGAKGPRILGAIHLN
jgi:anhydro-N-acetylmuramic acid kinase